MSAISLNAPAKINTILRVMGCRADGYHDLVMVMEKLNVRDEIIVEIAERDIELTIDGTYDAGMEAEKNLAWRAADVFRRATGEQRGVRIHLTKRIPVAAGLGGGSSDAAATLKGLNHLWGYDWTRQRLAQLGATLGADVPFFCFDGPAVVEGIGDHVTPLKKFPKLYVLLINPGFAVSTSWVYGQWDALRKRQVKGKSDRKIKGLTLEGCGVRLPPLLETVDDVVAHLVNDLEEVTIPRYPEVFEIKQYLLDAGARGALMSGSGPTVFGLFDDVMVRDRAASQVPREQWRVIAAEN